VQHWVFGSFTKGLQSASYNDIKNIKIRELANPNLYEVNLATAFKIELWDRYGRDHLRMVIVATSGIKIAHAAFNAAVRQYASERLTLRKRAMVLRKHIRRVRSPCPPLPPL